MNSSASLQSSASSSTGSSETPGGYWVDSSGTAHETLLLSVFVGKSYLGQTEFDPGDSPALGYRRIGIAYACPQCGEVWGRIVLTDSEGKQRPFGFEEVSCEKHHDHWNVPGSLLIKGLDALLWVLPLEALKREIEVNLKHHMKEDK